MSNVKTTAASGDGNRRSPYNGNNVQGANPASGGTGGGSGSAVAAASGGPVIGMAVRSGGGTAATARGSQAGRDEAANQRDRNTGSRKNLDGPSSSKYARISASSSRGQVSGSSGVRSGGNSSPKNKGNSTSIGQTGSKGGAASGRKRGRPSKNQSSAPPVRTARKGGPSRGKAKKAGKVKVPYTMKGTKTARNTSSRGPSKKAIVSRAAVSQSTRAKPNAAGAQHNSAHQRPSTSKPKVKVYNGCKNKSCIKAKKQMRTFESRTKENILLSFEEHITELRKFRRKLFKANADSRAATNMDGLIATQREMLAELHSEMIDGRLSKAQMQALLVLEWRGALCFTHHENLRLLSFDKLPCPCALQTDSMFDLEKALGNFRRYKEMAVALREKAAEILEASLRATYGDDNFPLIFPRRHTYQRKFKKILDREQNRYYWYGFRTKSAPIFIFDWTEDQKAGGILYKGKMNDSLTPTTEARLYLEQNLKQKQKLLAELRCNRDSYSCSAPRKALKAGCVPGHYTNGMLQYTTPYGISHGLLGVKGLSSPLTPIEESLTITTAACTSDCQCDNLCAQKAALSRGCRYLQAITVLPCKGKGVFAIDDMPRGAYLSKMAGRVLKDSQLNDKTRFPTIDHRMDLRITGFKGVTLSPGCDQSREAKVVYNPFLFYNTSCTPNVVQSYILEGREDSRWARFSIHTREEIKAGTELCWDYYSGRSILEMKTTANSFDFVCECGHENCRYSEEKWAEFEKEYAHEVWGKRVMQFAEEKKNAVLDEDEDMFSDDEDDVESVVDLGEADPELEDDSDGEDDVEDVESLDVNENHLQDKGFFGTIIKGAQSFLSFFR